MSYRIFYDDKIIYDPYSNDVITDPKLSAESNAAHYFDFTISPKHTLYNVIQERSGIITVYSDRTKLFAGYVSEIADDFDGYKDITCVGVLDYLGDTLVRPYSTIDGEQELTAPSSYDGYFQWLIDQHNSHMLDSRKQFTVGINQAGLLDKNNYIYRSSTQLPTTASEIENKILDYGGYLSVRYENATNVLDFYADAHESNTQIIDFGVNLIDFKRTSSVDKQYTAVRPMGATPQSTETGKQEKPITIASLSDGGTKYPDIAKMGDVVYSISGVTRYGYREYSYSNTDITTQDYLLDAACTQLQRLLSPSLTLDIQAVDMALFVEGFDHLDIGQAVRVRSKPHNIDEYLMVTSIDLDLQDPGNTEYTLGVTYDTLTGQQSAYLKSLNSGINSALDSVEKIDQTAKDAAKNADEALIASSKSIIKTDEEYYNSVSPTELSGGEWQNENVWEDSKYVWNRSLITYGDNTTEYSPSEIGICISGNTGETGPKGEQGDDGQMLYATSSTESNAGDKIATLSSGEIILTDGLTVSVTFTNGNTAASPTLNINSTGSKPIYTNGVQFAYWTAGATVVFVYASGSWYSASTPVYANTATIGNPADKNIYIDSDSVDIRTGSIVSSSFTADTVSLGQNSPSATINMRGNTFSINTHKEDNPDGDYEIAQIENVGDNFRIHAYNEDAKDEGNGIGISENYRETSIESQYAHGTKGSYDYNSMTLNLFAEAGYSTSRSVANGAIQIYADATSEFDSETSYYKGESSIRLLADKIYLYDNALLADIVFESGIKDGWHYKKWLNGEMECWKKIEYKNTGWNSWGSIYESIPDIPQYTYPITFKDVPSFRAEICDSTLNHYISGIEYHFGNGTASKSPNFVLLRGTSYDRTGTYYMTIYAKGLWK